MDELNRYLEERAGEFEDELVEYLSIPSVSTDPDRAGDVDACARWLAGRLRGAGVASVEVVETGGHPIVLGVHDVGPARPTLLVYGHYDVQPADPLDEWTSPPFRPDVRDGRLYARGAADNKGQNHVHVKALEAVHRVRGRIPVNLRVVIEGEEEVGSAHLADFLRENEDRLECDAVLLSDTEMWSKELPTLVTGLRGLAYFEITVRGPNRDLHSGLYGGPVPNPANALARILAGLRDEDGRVTLPGFYDAVRPLTEEDREAMARVPFDAEEFREEVGVPALGGEASYPPLALLGYRPTLDVNGLLSGFTGEGAKTVLPALASAKVSTRLVPDQDPGQVEAALRERVRELTPPGVAVEVETFHGALPWADRPTGPIAAVAEEAMEEVFGQRPLRVRNGGSIPIIPLLARTFGATVLPIGFALPGCNMHAPDEWLDLEVYHRGIQAMARLYARLGDASG